eukprot:m.230743 g.230743  ORF g.230743 m.230743 type:complete len:320 (+) comp18137_c0_seq1:135-1094(+)
MSRTERLPPPIVGKVSDTTIHLYWNALPGNPRFCVQEFDTAKSTDWGNVYTGQGLDTTITNLEPQNAYRFRIRAVYDDEPTQWSPVITVSTTRKAISGEDLHKAVLARDLPAVRDILESGHVSVDVPDKLGYSPLMNAAQRGHVRIAEELIHRGADVSFSNSSGKSSLILAAFEGHVPMLELLLREHANIHQRDRSGMDALHGAVTGDQAAAAAFLLTAGSAVDGLDASGWSPLIRCASISGNAAVARVLLKAGADPNASDSTHKTPLMTAALGGHEELVKVLLEAGADPAVESEHGGRAIDFAMGFGYSNIVTLLSEK